MSEEPVRSNSLYGDVADPCTVVLFGASGDLAKRKVIPAMYDLAQYNALGERYRYRGIRAHADDQRVLPLHGGRSGQDDFRGGSHRSRQMGRVCFQSLLFPRRLCGSEFLRGTSQDSCRPLRPKKTWAAIDSFTFPRRPKFIRTSSNNSAAQVWRGPLTQIPGFASS